MHHGRREKERVWTCVYHCCRAGRAGWRLAEPRRWADRVLRLHVGVCRVCAQLSDGEESPPLYSPITISQALGCLWRWDDGRTGTRSHRLDLAVQK